jgi:transposase InsO family protein
VAEVVEFILEIINCYGVANRIITDNGSQFIATEFKDFCSGHHVKIQYASVAHPQSNRQVE